MTDSHIHVGWFIDRYHAPDVVTMVLREAGVSMIAVSSTSTCAYEYECVISEMLWLQEEWGDFVFPLLWVVPDMLQSDSLTMLLSSGVKWRGIKMHWQSTPDFYYKMSLAQTVINDTRFSGPIILHTGEFPECHASVFNELIKNNPLRNFILAHGRPLDETLNLLTTYPNAYVDTAFMKCQDIVNLVNRGLTNRILWGSDCPINEHFHPSEDSGEYLKSRIFELKKEVSDKVFNQITEENFKTVFRRN